MTGSSKGGMATLTGSAFLLLFAFATATQPVFAQNTPKTDCLSTGLTGFEVNLELATVRSGSPVTAYSGWSCVKKCLPAKVEAGGPVLVYRTEGGWDCGHYTDPSFGGGTIWIKAKDIQPVKEDRNPPLSAWDGTYVGGEVNMNIVETTAGTLRLDGSSKWDGGQSDED